MHRRLLPVLSWLLLVVLASRAQAQPDLIVSDATNLTKWGTVGGITAYSFGLSSCNIGDQPVLWAATINQHPVMALNIYRLRDGALDQIGMSWLMHGFCALDQSCGSCTPTGCGSLGIGCATTNSASILGQQQNLGPRSDVNASTGEFGYPFPTQGQGGDAIFKRCQVHNDDLDPALNPGALYFGVVQFVTADEPAFGTHFNNTSYRPIAVGGMSGGGFNLSFTGSTATEADPIQAWADHGNGVMRTVIDTPENAGLGQIVVGSRVEDLGGGQYRYRYAIYNSSSERGIRGLTIPHEPGAAITDVRFHAVDYHSGEPYSANDWSEDLTPGAITWSTESHAQNENANALRWGSTYGFGFDSSAPPQLVTASIELFQPGAGTSLGFSVLGPGSGVSFSRGDCNVDGGMDISDAIFLLAVLFDPAVFASCLDACDANDDGAADIADAVYTLSALFGMGPLPPPPHPECGVDPTDDALDCSAFGACP